MGDGVGVGFGGFKMVLWLWLEDAAVGVSRWFRLYSRLVRERESVVLGLWGECDEVEEAGVFLVEMLVEWLNVLRGFDLGEMGGDDRVAALAWLERGIMLRVCLGNISGLVGVEKLGWVDLLRQTLDIWVDGGWFVRSAMEGVDGLRVEHAADG